MHQDHLISASHLSREDIETMLDRAADVDTGPAAFRQRHTRKVLGLRLFELSTRTRVSFDSTMKRLGSRTIDMKPAESSSVEKGETLADTVRVIEGYADTFVLHHPSEGVAATAAEFVDMPLINAGDGMDQHPSQALLDLYTIRGNAGLDDLTIGIMGDLKYGRTVHSLAEALTNFDANQHFISPESPRLPRNAHCDFHVSDAQVKKHTELGEVLPGLDMLYATRIQHERSPDGNEYRKAVGQYQIDSETLDAVTDSLTIIHPLPRVDEISPGIDDADHATYFEQAHNGIPARMALLDILLSQNR